MIPINTPQIGDDEIEAAVRVLKSGILTNGLGAGPMVREFEKAFSDFVEAKHAIAVNTGTSSLHLSIAGAGVGKGDEVIIPSFTFVATAEVVVLAGAIPVFVDIDPETYNISPKKIEDALTQSTRAILPVDLYGLPADMQPIREIAEKNDLVVIEDSCQAHGASYGTKPPGVLADAACWSFYASKNMTTGEGGMITLNDDELAEKLRFMRSHGEKEKYKSLMLGHNYHMPEIQAAIGLAQLRKLPGFLERRRRNASQLTQKFKDAENLVTPLEPEDHRHSWYLYTIRLKGASRAERDSAIEELRKKGIGAEIYYSTPIHLMPYYRRFSKRKLPETESASQQVLSLPVHPGVSSAQIEAIGEAALRIVE